MKKSGKLACHVVNSNIAIGSLPTLQTLHGLFALIEKIYYGDPIFTLIYIPKLNVKISPIIGRNSQTGSFTCLFTIMTQKKGGKYSWER